MSKKTLKSVLADIFVWTVILTFYMPFLWIWKGMDDSLTIYVALYLVTLIILVPTIIRDHKTREKICEQFFEPLLQQCRLMIKEFEENPADCPQIKKSKREVIHLQKCYMALKQNIYPDLMNSYHRLQRKEVPIKCPEKAGYFANFLKSHTISIRGIGLSCTSTVLELFDEQSDFAQMVLELDKALNPKRKKEKKK